jgi:hypothetical protein
MRNERVLTVCDTCQLVPVFAGSCVGCRVRRTRGAGIDGERCCVPSCGIDQPRVLRWHRFTDETVALCANHSALAGRRPLTSAKFLAESAASGGSFYVAGDGRPELE